MNSINDKAEDAVIEFLEQDKMTLDSLKEWFEEQLSLSIKSWCKAQS